MSNDYVTITREQLKQLLILARLADVGFQALDNEGIPFSELDYRVAIMEFDCDDIGKAGEISSETYVEQTLTTIHLLNDVDYRSALK